MAKEIREIPLNFEELAANARSIQTGPNLYSNHFSFTMTQDELVLDFFYYAAPYSTRSKVESTHLQRIIMPKSAAQNLIIALGEIIDKPAQ